MLINKRWQGGLWISIICILLLMNILNYFEIFVSNIMLLMAQLAVMLVGALIIALALPRVWRMPINKFFLTAALFFALSTIPFVLNTSKYADIMVAAVNYSFWFVCLCVFMIIFSSSTEDDFKLLNNLLVFVFFVYSLIYIAVILTTDVETEVIGSINCVYYPLLLSPLVFLVEKPIVKIAITTVSVLLVFVSGKRAAFIALALALVIPFVFKAFKKSNRKRITYVILVIAVLALVLLLFDWLAQNYDIEIFDRLASTAEDGGSGRTDIYGKVLEAIKENNIGELLLGNGFNTVFYDGVSGTSAHNDLLEIFYDYGLFALIAYLAFIITAIGVCISLYKKDNKCAESVLSATLIFAVMTMVSHLVIYPTYFVFIIYFWVQGIRSSKNQQDELTIKE
ncbi:MAG: O-antigen ligase family protein [Clostridia bacterium]|nr:O-antigen ligase family protein [Clostridia bacterium]